MAIPQIRAIAPGVRGAIRIALVAACTALVAACSSGTAPTAHSADASTATCLRDAGVDKTGHDAIAKAAEGFTAAVFGEDPSKALAFVSKQWQDEAVRQEFMKQSSGYHGMVDPGSLAVEHVYFVRLKGPAPDVVFCEGDAGSGRTAVRPANLPEQAFVAATASAPNDRVAVSLWLVPENGEWKVRMFSIDPATVGRKDAGQIFEWAKAQESAGHAFNAWVLYAAAGRLASRGPFLLTESAHAISEAVAGKKPPSGLDVRPPWEWKDDGTTFKVLGIQYLGGAGKINLAIDHEVPAGTGDEAMDRANKALIAYFKRRYPEYSDVFAGLLVRAHAQGTGKGFATFDETPAR